MGCGSAGGTGGRWEVGAYVMIISLHQSIDNHEPPIVQAEGRCNPSPAASVKGQERRSMEQIINGLRYSTEAAALVASDRYWDGNNWERSGRNTYLYKTKNGRFFLHHTTQWTGERDHIEPVSIEEARQYYEDLPEQEIDYVEAFGDEPGEA